MFRARLEQPLLERSSTFLGHDLLLFDLLGPFEVLSIDPSIMVIEGPRQQQQILDVLKWHNNIP